MGSICGKYRLALLIISVDVECAVHTLAQIGPVKYDLLTRKHHRLGNLRRYSLGMNGKYET